MRGGRVAFREESPAVLWSSPTLDSETKYKQLHYALRKIPETSSQEVAKLGEVDSSNTYLIGRTETLAI